MWIQNYYKKLKQGAWKGKKYYICMIKPKISDTGIYMKTGKILPLMLAALSWSVAFAATDIGEVIDECPQKAGGIYYAYDVEYDSIAPVPDGFRPVYISHYGRHGSRWPVKQRIYSEASGFFQQQQLAENLTQEGKEVWKLVGICAANAQGHLGELTAKGENQHRGVAERMVNRFPSLFSDGAGVVARSSVEPRCIMSMMAFCDRLKEMKPDVQLKKTASPGDMEFIHHKSIDAEMMTGEDAPWMWGFHNYRDSVSRCPKLAEKLFKSVPQSDSLEIFMRSLYDVAISVQDIDSLDADILSRFDTDELAGLWKAANYMQYAGNGKSPMSGHTGPQCAVTLLREICSRADEMLADCNVNVDLRFGHDTDLLRLISLIDAGGAGVELEDPDEIAEKWRNFDISPMGANLQFVFFKNDAGAVLLMPRLNERPVEISDVPQIFPGYYDWEVVKTFFLEQ